MAIVSPLSLVPTFGVGMYLRLQAGFYITFILLSFATAGHAAEETIISAGEGFTPVG